MSTWLNSKKKLNGAYLMNKKKKKKYFSQCNLKKMIEKRNFFEDEWFLFVVHPIKFLKRAK